MAMIIVNLKGGLGNQMFQYACGRALALRNDSELKLNVFGLEKANLLGDIYRPYSLSHFDVKAGIATKEDIQRVANPLGTLSKAIRYIKAKFIYSFYIHFVPQVLREHGNVYLDGFFQSEKYFIDYEKEIREDLKPKTLSNLATNWVDYVRSKESVSLHVRRADYVGHKTLGDICTKDYYKRAINKMREMARDPHYLVFSDDVAWVKENLNLPETTDFVSSKELKDYEELAIMSACKGNIIANSSFSWWAAWLNPNEDKTVIAPAIWARGREGARQTEDIIPKGWLRIEIGRETAL